MFKNLVNLILDVVLIDMFNEIELEEKGIENYRYRLIYGNFFFGGVDSELYLEDFVDIEKESVGEERLLKEEIKLDCFK